MWTTLFPSSSDRRQGLRSRSKPIFPMKSSSVSEAPLCEEDFRMVFQMERGVRASPLFHCHLSRIQKRCSREGTSSSSGEAALCNPHSEEDKEGSLGQVGSNLRGLPVMDSPSGPEIRGKGFIFEGICEIPRVENSEHGESVYHLFLHCSLTTGLCIASSSSVVVKLAIGYLQIIWCNI
ncbi:uncharacterized protein LOC117928290 [Vitis riparia]|uniref:uncharacterized protein LOC117928290 n=1 Tax=Vitis riparia TaxID=96939 RepID=UPI00155A3017|nr:uncharacterized protein LOC117928290 [Vitis riparia]